MSVADDIKARLDIVDVVSDHVSLRKAGRNFKATCPFHTEKTPSFVVSPERQSWRCFGACATGGDAFSFVMRVESIGYGEALKALAERAGVTLHRQRDSGKYEALYRINQEAARFFQERLASTDGQQARGYLDERGVDSKTTEAFQLGLSPRGRDGLNSYLTGLGFGVDQAVEAGLLRRDDDGTVRDFFWGRLMFPIHDRQGRVAGFGARTLAGSDPKYLNTAATPVFDKRATLYGLHMAIAQIREKDVAVIVEGYMDAIAAHQHGYTNVVASMGTALTEQQIRQLRSTAKEFVQALDPDDAGQEATRRSLESSYHVFARQLGQKAQVVLKIAALPEGRDPDRFIRETPKEWEQLILDAVPFMEFALPAFARRHDLETAQGKAQAAEDLLPLITATTNAFEQEQHLRMLAVLLGVSKEMLEASIGRPRAVGPARRQQTAGRGRPRAASVSPLLAGRSDFLEDYVLALLLNQPELRERAQTLAPERFHRTENREVYISWQRCSTIDELRLSLDDSLNEHIDHLSDIPMEPADRRSHETALDQSLRRLEERYLQELQEGLLATGDSTVPPPRELEEAIVGVNTRLKELYTTRADS